MIRGSAPESRQVAAWIRPGLTQRGISSSARRRYFSPMIHCASTLDSDGDTWGNGGIMIGPHFPEPPLWICSSILAAASASVLYFTAMSRYAGPTIFIVALWHPKQPYFAATCGPSLVACTGA